MNKKEITQIIREEIQKIIGGKVGTYKVSYKYKDDTGELYQAFDETHEITQEDIDKSFDREDTSLENLLKSIIEKDMDNTINVGKFYSIKPL
jgi:hypothetical protein